MMKIAFISEISNGFGGGKRLKETFCEALKKTKEICLKDANRADVIHLYNTNSKINTTKPIILTVNGWALTCPLGFQANTYNEKPYERPTFIRTFRNYLSHPYARSRIKGLLMLPYIWLKFLNRRKWHKKHSAKIVAISHVLKKVLEKNDIEVDEVIYEPVNPIFFKGKPMFKSRNFVFHGGTGWLSSMEYFINLAKTTKFDIKVYGKGHYIEELKKAGIYGGYISDIEQLQRILNSSFCYLYLNKNNPFGQSLVEAMAAGLPIIALNRGFASEIIKHEYNGLLANNLQEVRDLMKFLVENPKEAKRIGENARKTALKEFLPEKIIKEYVNLYREVLKI